MTDDERMSLSQPCQHVDVALYFQQIARVKDAADGSPMTVAIGEPCGQPSVAASLNDEGAVEHVCDLHLHQRNLVRG